MSFSDAGMRPTGVEAWGSAILDAAFDRASVGMAVGGVDGSLLRVNPAFARMLDYTPDQLTGVPWVAITDPADRHSGVALVHELRSGKASVLEQTKRYLARDGHAVLARVRVALTGPADASPQLVIVEPAPEEPSSLWNGPRHRRWLDNTLDPAALADIDSRLLQVNDAFCALLRQARPAMLGRTLGEFLVEEEVTPWQAAIRLLPDVGALRRNVRLQQPDGSLASAEVSITDLGDGLIQIVLHDVSHWRALLRRDAYTPGAESAPGDPYPLESFRPQGPRI